MIKRHKSLQGESEKAEGSLQRILRVLFERHQFELKLSQGCTHELLRKYFYSHTVCFVKDSTVVSNCWKLCYSSCVTSWPDATTNWR
jgi:hypothetical protein